jgi:hypothetical protein
VSKYSADRRDVLWTTFIGEGVSHSLDDVFNGIISENGPFTEVQAIALDGEHAVITGWTNAPHFPKTAGAFHNPNLGPGIGPCVYVAKLTDNGDDLVYASHPITIGKGFGIGVDQAGRVCRRDGTGRMASDNARRGDPPAASDGSRISRRAQRGRQQNRLRDVYRPGPGTKRRLHVRIRRGR